MGRKILFTLLFSLFFSNQNALALDLQVTATNETCTGNGSLTFSVTNSTYYYVLEFNEGESKAGWVYVSY